MSAKAKPKRVRAIPDDLKALDTKSRTRGARVILVDGHTTPKSTVNGKIARRRNPAQPDLLKTLPEARERVFERHYPELAKAEKPRRRKSGTKKQYERG